MGREDVDCLAARPPVLNQLRVSDHSPVCTLLPSHLTPRPHCTLHYYHNSPGTLATLTAPELDTCHGCHSPPSPAEGATLSTCVTCVAGVRYK